MPTEPRQADVFLPFIELFVCNIDYIELKINDMLDSLLISPYNGKPVTRILMKSLLENVILLSDIGTIEKLLASKVNIMDFLNFEGLQCLLKKIQNEVELLRVTITLLD